MNILPFRRPQPEQPVPLLLHAMDNLAYIRETMARSGSFTAVPGWGIASMGIMALIASFVATWNLSPDWWIYTWFYTAIVGAATGVCTLIHKAQSSDTPILLGPGRRFLLNFLPAIAVGCVLTEVYYDTGLAHRMPAMWLMLYGLGVLSAGAFSISIVPLMGLSFMTLGAITAFIVPIRLSLPGGVYAYDVVLALGFGIFHIVFGLIIALRHGG